MSAECHKHGTDLIYRGGNDERDLYGPNYCPSCTLEDAQQEIERLREALEKARQALTLIREGAESARGIALLGLNESGDALDYTKPELKP